MRKRLSGMLRPGMGLYFIVMALFCLTALVRRHYWLAAAETAVTMVLFVLYLMSRARRNRKLQQYVQTVENTLEFTSRGEAPLPAVMIRLGDGGIVWGNHRFSELTGYADSMLEQTLEEVLPDFSVDWLSSGKTESPRDVTMAGRRYRVYGSVIRA